MNYLEKKKKAMLNYVSGGRLPSEYQEVEYIESNGTPYINSGVKLVSTYGFECKFYTNSVIAGGGNYGCIFGGRTSGGNRDYQLTSYGNANGGTVRWGATQQGEKSPIGMVRYTVQKCSIRNSIFTDCNGNQSTVPTTLLQSTQNAYLFGLNNGGSFAQSGLGCRIYYLKFYDDTDTLIRDFVPCYRKADQVIGMYDLVEGTFYTNAGNGTFTKGNDV